MLVARSWKAIVKPTRGSCGRPTRVWYFFVVDRKRSTLHAVHTGENFLPPRWLHDYWTADRESHPFAVSPITTAPLPCCVALLSRRNDIVLTTYILCIHMYNSNIIYMFNFRQRNLPLHLLRYYVHPNYVYCSNINIF